MRHARRFTWVSAAVLLVGCALAQTELCRAHEGKANAETSDPVILKTYDVQDILTPIPDYPSQGWFDTSGVGQSSSMDESESCGPALFGGAPLSVEPRLGEQSLIDMLQRFVNHQHDARVALWADEGGAAAIEPIGSSLLVSQNAEGHARIQEALQAIRGRGNAQRMLTVEARWIVVENAKVKQLAGTGPKREVPCPVTDAALEKAGAAVRYQGEVTAFNGQMVCMNCWINRAYLADAKPVVINGATLFEPTIGALWDGAVLQVKPMLIADGGEVRVDVRSQVVEHDVVRIDLFGDVGQVEGTGQPGRAYLEFPQLSCHEFRTTVRLPLDKPVLISGMTDPQAKKGEMLYLVLKVSASE